MENLTIDDQLSKDLLTAADELLLFPASDTIESLNLIRWQSKEKDEGDEGEKGMYMRLDAVIKNLVQVQEAITNAKIRQSENTVKA